MRRNRVRNLRDFGGITNQNGQVIRSGLFIRSAALSKLSSRGVKRLEKKHIIRVIDLRNEAEIEDKPDVVPPQAKWEWIPLLNVEASGITHERDRDYKKMIPPDMRDMYRTFITNPQSIEGLRKVFALLCNEPVDGATLWHCSEGKDRCGLVSALFLSLLDVDEKTIYEDYLKTNKSARRRARMYFYLVLVGMRSPKLARGVHRIFIADASYLDAAFDEIRKRYGDVASFLKNEIHVTDEMKAALQARCLMN